MRVKSGGGGRTDGALIARAAAAAVAVPGSAAATANAPARKPPPGTVPRHYCSGPPSAERTQPPLLADGRPAGWRLEFSLRDRSLSLRAPRPMVRRALR